jgi:hypothetical protein
MVCPTHVCVNVGEQTTVNAPHHEEVSTWGAKKNAISNQIEFNATVRHTKRKHLPEDHRVHAIGTPTVVTQPRVL